jgi:malate permease and related proteins
MGLLNAVQSVLSIFIMLSIGWFMAHAGWFDERSPKLLSRLVVNVSLPLYMISNLMSTYDREKLLNLGIGVVIPFAVMLTGYGISILVSRLIYVPPERTGTFRSMFALSNTIFVGLPVNIALFGDGSLPFVLLYYIANTTLFWTIGVHGIRKDGGHGDDKLFSLENIRRIFSPPLTGFLLAVVLILLGIQLPKSIMDTCKYMGNLTTPISMLFIGMIIHSVKWKEIKIGKEMLVLLGGRFILAPVIVLVLCYFLPIPLLMKKVFVIQAAMPAMTQTAIIAEAYGADYKYAAIMTTVTTVVSLVFIPVYMLLLGS